MISLLNSRWQVKKDTVPVKGYNAYLSRWNTSLKLKVTQCNSITLISPP